MLPDESIFREHITKAHFLIGADDGIWGLHGSSDDIVWPHAFFWCKATPPQGVGADKYYFRFALDGYPSTPPMATPWNIETNQVLDREKWPQWSVYLQEVFKWDWRKGQALYSPCDRSIVGTNHDRWKEQHAAYWWTPEFTIVQYLRFLVGILNNNEEW